MNDKRNTGNQPGVGCALIKLYTRLLLLQKIQKMSDIAWISYQGVVRKWDPLLTWQQYDCIVLLLYLLGVVLHGVCWVYIFMGGVGVSCSCNYQSQ